MSITGSHYLNCKNRWSLLSSEPRSPLKMTSTPIPSAQTLCPSQNPHNVRSGFFCQQSHSDCPTFQGDQANHISHNPPGSSVTLLWVVFLGPVQPSSALPVHVTMHIGVRVLKRAQECTHKETNQTPMSSSACGEMDL